MKFPQQQPQGWLHPLDLLPLHSFCAWRRLQGANFYRTVEMIETNLAAKPLVVTLPIGAEDNFQGVVDLVAMNAITWGGEVGSSFPLGTSSVVSTSYFAHRAEGKVKQVS